MQELAENAGFNQKVFSEDLAAYNEACDAGEDKMIGKPAKYLVKHGEGPYEAIEGEPVALDTVGSQN